MTRAGMPLAVSIATLTLLPDTGVAASTCPPTPCENIGVSFEADLNAVTDANGAFQIVAIAERRYQVTASMEEGRQHVRRQNEGDGRER